METLPIQDSADKACEQIKQKDTGLPLSETHFKRHLMIVTMDQLIIINFDVSLTLIGTITILSKCRTLVQSRTSTITTLFHFLSTLLGM